MPPVTKAGGSAFRKDVAFVAKDEDEQIAAGIVMVPDKVDLQNDFAREATIREFAAQFGDFAEVGQADGGVMHAVWPSEWMHLERNEVLDEAEDIGGQTVEAGAWVQEWAFDDADLWSLVDDGVLEGYSIGAINVDWNGPFEQGDVDDVAIPDAIDEGDLIWELTDGIIREVSAVDIPAVPDAQILDTKADAEKRLADHLGNRDGFIEEAVERGHTEAEAERLWDVLNRAADIEGAGDPGTESMLGRAGKAFLNALTGNGTGNTSRTAETPDEDPRTAKEGRTLSKQNRESLFATIDASLDVLNDAGVDDLPKRFTDREDTDFDLTEHNARELGAGEDDDGDADATPINNATGGDTPADDTTTDMSDDTPDDPMADAPEWAKALNDRIDDMEGDTKDADAGDGAGDTDDRPEWAKTLEARLDELEANLDTDDGTDDRPEWAKELEERVDTIARQSGHSQQLNTTSDDEGGESGLGDLGKALS